MKSGLSTNIGIFILKLVAKLPFSFIHFLSGVFYPVVYYFIGYRKDVVVRNLHNSFPEKNKKEIKIITRKFFRHFSDLTLETIKMREMDEKDFRERMVIRNPEVINRFFDEGRSVVLLTMHYNNWEWSNCLPLVLRHTVLGVYKPLHNTLFDVFMNKTREKQGAEMVANAHVLRRLLKAGQNNELVLSWLAGDQTPPEFHKFWMRFLNQDAMFYPGPASLSRRFNHPVFFQTIEKVSRGHYQTSFELLFENPKEVDEVEIIKKYIAKMEEIIREKPEYYLWSHKRWKHKRPEGMPLLC
jgi:KDO2-lipid IV(A) lauroyltransferase